MDNEAVFFTSICRVDEHKVKGWLFGVIDVGYEFFAALKPLALYTIIGEIPLYRLGLDLSVGDNCRPETLALKCVWRFPIGDYVRPDKGDSKVKVVPTPKVDLRLISPPINSINTFESMQVELLVFYSYPTCL